MYNLEQIVTEKDEMREAVLNARAYKPIYVKIKVNYGCNLKCEMCKHWRETRESPISMNRFKEIITELGELGCKKIHFSGFEFFLWRQGAIHARLVVEPVETRLPVPITCSVKT